MPGEVTQSLRTQPICRCGHFRFAHRLGQGKCDGCACKKFDEIPFDESPLGKAIKECADALQEK